MTTPRLEIDLEKIQHNARALVERLAARNISVTGVTKATLGSPEIARALLRAGVKALGDSRIENIEAMRRARVPAAMTLLRSPMLSQVDRVVTYADVSFNTELDVIDTLSSAARKIQRTHGIVLMVELGDLREGILPGDLEATARKVLRFPNIALKGIGTNLAYRCGGSLDAKKMTELSTLADSLEAALGLGLEIVSGGSSANLEWASSDADTGRINDLRLGESILLGRQPLDRQPIEGLYTDAVTLVAEVIESKGKPSRPWGVIAENAFGEKMAASDHDHICQTILAVGHQDTDPGDLYPPPGIAILGASNDLLIVNSGSSRLPVGTEIPFQLGDRALVRSMTSPLVTKDINPSNGLPVATSPILDVRRPFSSTRSLLN